MPEESEVKADRSRPLHDRVFQNIVGLLSGRVLGLLLSGFTSILLARYLGSLDLGRYAALYAYVTLFGWLGSFGLDQIITRESARRRDEAGSILMTGTLIGAIFCGSASILAFLSAPAAGYTGQLRWLLVIVTVDLLILTPAKWPGMVFQVDLRQWLGVSIGLFRQVIWILVIVVCASLKASLHWLVAGRLFCGLVETGITLAVSFRFFVQPWRILYGEIRTLLIHAAPVGFSTLAVGIYHRIDQVLLHKLVNDRELGQYVVAVNLTEILSAFPAALMASMFPILSQLATDEPRFDQYVRLSFRYLNVLAFGLCIIIALGSRNIIHLLYGQAFVIAAPMLAALIWSECGAFFGSVMSCGLIARNLQGLTVVPNVLGAVFNLALNLVFIPRWGGLGAAWATTISNLIAGVLAFLLFPAARRLADLGLRTFVSAAAAAALTMLLGVPLAGLPILVKLSLGAIIYISMIWLMGLFGRDDLLRAWSLVSGKRATLESQA
ncbi:MAG TPA: oligosaccharide flippase family protein [Candidatus Acidoferrales bacterium]|nr:oligosaccharide flippase family protein [Candidatus Acidoferrales bacterium]